MNEKIHRRKNLYVSNAIQGRLLRRLAIYWVFYHVVLWHAMFLHRCLESYQEFTSGVGDPVTFYELYRSFFFENYSLLACAFAGFPVIFWDMLILSHGIAGPLIRFQRGLRRMARGQQVEKLTLRVGDLVDDLLDAYNELVESTQERRDVESRRLQSLQAEDRTDATAGAQYKEVLDELAQLKQSVSQLHRDRIPQDETFQNSTQHPYVENEAEIVDDALVAAE